MTVLMMMTVHRQCDGTPSASFGPEFGTPSIASDSAPILGAIWGLPVRCIREGALRAWDVGDVILVLASYAVLAAELG